VIELVGGSGPHEGNIMLYGRPVCDDIATPENAQVVCRQLGYLGGYILTESFFGPVSSDFVMDDVNCNGTEEYIWRCPHDTEPDCGGSEGMGVVCSNEGNDITNVIISVIQLLEYAIPTHPTPCHKNSGSIFPF